MQKRTFAFLLALCFSPVAAHADDFSDLFCGHKCKLRKQQEQEQINKEEEEAEENEKAQQRAEQQQRIDNIHRNPRWQAVHNSISVTDFLVDSDSLDGKVVYVRGTVYCGGLNSCNIHYPNDASKSIWFDPANLSVENKKALLSCPENLSCISVIKGVVQKQSLTKNGESITEEALVAMETSFVNLDISWFMAQ
ncbi:hypothetical protein [Komagataeibacter xylinus]|uniref:hypothetical protein n=1 Tax=Komagataeibacter xylinus TaxID=28448 RepID=UPI000AD781C8|nr:hypothetical protein [Komagataeibacter xylinus]GBQ75071.1 hypothetical protein AA15237_2031 [Komagataeibacter xylinus NBRC 15237]